MFQHISKFNSFIWLNTIPLHVFYTLLIHLLMNISVSLFLSFPSIVAMNVGIQCFQFFFEYIVMSRSAKVLW